MPPDLPFLKNGKMKDGNNHVIPVTMNFANATEIGKNAFGNTGAMYLTFPKVTTVGNNAFYWAGVLKLVMPKITTLGTSTNQRFYYIQKTEELIFSGLTMSTSPTAVIGTGCTGTLQVLDMGKTSKLSAHMRSFTALKTVILRNTSVVTFSQSSVYSSGLFAGTSPIGKGTGKIYVPSNLVDTYKTTNGWSTYASCFTAIEGSDYE